jgi:hypothetical protein
VRCIYEVCEEKERVYMYVRKLEGGLRAKSLLYRYLGLKMTQIGA